MMRQSGLRFNGVVKTATKEFPQAYLSNLEMTERGEFSGVVASDEQAATKEFPQAYLSNLEMTERGEFSGVVASDEQGDYLAFVWMDRNWRYFISTAGSLKEGAPYNRTRWRPVDQTPSNAPPSRVDLVIAQPIAAEIYYFVCGLIDQHNRCRQDDLQLERKLKI